MIRKTVSVCLTLLALLIVSLVYPPVSYGYDRLNSCPTCEDDSPEQTLKNKVSQIQDLIQNDKLDKKERKEFLRQIVESLFDMHELTRRILGRHWPKDTDEQNKLVALFNNLLEHNYFRHVEMVKNMEFSYGSPRFDGDVVKIHSQGVLPNGEKFEIVYSMHRTSGGWKIYDLSVWGISLVSNFRSQTNDIIQRYSYQELITRLEKKNLK